jgi:hypothetical protein
MASLFRKCLIVAITLAIGAPSLTTIGQEATLEAGTSAATPAGVTVIASGLNNPRGFAWDDAGTLHLVQAGWGGDFQFPAAEGFTIDSGLTGSIGTLADGCVTPTHVGLNSVFWVEAGWVFGTMDVAVRDGELFAAVGGGGPSWANPTGVSGIYRANDDGSMTLVANLTAWLPENPLEFMAPDIGADGSLVDLEATTDGFLLTIADYGELLHITPDGVVTLRADLSVDHLVPTGIAVDADGNAYVGFETTPPYPDGGSKVVKVAPDGTVTDHWTGLTAVVDVEFGPDGVLYAAELSVGNTEEPPFFSPNAGRIVRQTGPDSFEVVVSDSPPPVYMGFSGDGMLHFTLPAFGANGGTGQGEGALVSIDPSQGPISLAGISIEPTCAI